MGLSTGAKGASHPQCLCGVPPPSCIRDLRNVNGKNAHIQVEKFDKSCPLARSQTRQNFAFWAWRPGQNRGKKIAQKCEKLDTRPEKILKKIMILGVQEEKNKVK
jgi:hypothetical protein